MDNNACLYPNDGFENISPLMEKKPENEAYHVKMMHMVNLNLLKILPLNQMIFLMNNSQSKIIILIMKALESILK